MNHIHPMQFTLVTTCLNEMRSLTRWRADLAAQTRQPDEIVIVDAVSSDGTTEALRQWAAEDPRLRVRVEKCNAARGRNLAIEMAAHEHIVSTDMGVRLDPCWFAELVRPFEEDLAVAIVAGSYAIDPETLCAPASRAEYYLVDGGVARFGSDFVPGNRSLAYIRNVWRELGGLPEDLTLYADDSVFGRQMVRGGYKMAFAPAAMVYWARPQTLRAFWQEQFRYGRGDGEAAIKTPFAFRLHRAGKLPRRLVAPLTALRTVQTTLTFKAFRNGLRRGDWRACLLIPLLALGNGYYFAKGYLVGYAHGEQHCQACRQRLASPPDTSTKTA